MLYILGAIIGIYAFARKVVKNEPYKSKLDLYFDIANIKLNLYKDKNPKAIINYLFGIGKKVFYCLIVVIAIIFLLPEWISNQLFKITFPAFLISGLLFFSISWIQKHTKTFKEYFFNFQTLFFLFSPLIFYFFDFYFQPEGIKFSQIFESLPYVSPETNIIYFQLIWIILFVSIFYLGILLIALPIYLLLYTIIVTISLFLKVIYRYIDKHILDGVFGALTLLAVIIKIFF